MISLLLIDCKSPRQKVKITEFVLLLLIIIIKLTIFWWVFGCPTPPPPDFVGCFCFSSSSSRWVCLSIRLCGYKNILIWVQHSDLVTKLRRWLNSSVVLMITRPHPKNSLIESSYYYYSSFLIVCFSSWVVSRFIPLNFFISRFKKRKQNKWFFKKGKKPCVFARQKMWSVSAQRQGTRHLTHFSNFQNCYSIFQIHRLPWRSLADTHIQICC